MPTPILMPQLGESVTEGTVARWLKQEGERVERDEPLLEITTDKVNADMPSPVAGILVRQAVAEGAVVPVGAELAQIEESGVTPKAATDFTVIAARRSAPGDAAGEAPPPNEVSTGEGERRRRHSPLVRNLAAEHGIDLAQIRGTGLGGRVTKDDVLAFVAQQAGVQGPAQRSEPERPDVAERVTRAAVLDYVGRQESRHDGATSRDLERPSSGISTVPPPAAMSSTAQDRDAAVGFLPGLDDEVVPLSAMRRGIAEHMVRSVYTAPHATTVTEVDMTGLVRWRDRHKEAFLASNGVEITYVAFVVQAVVEALRAFPYLNSSWGGDKIILKKSINIGIAVGMDDGLLVPVIHRADDRSLVGIARAVADLVARARSGKLRIEELQGGTFTVNNTGVFGSIVSTPVINQPQAAILSMEAIVKRPVVIDDAIAIRSMMNICLSFDHRVIDGLMAGRFCQMVRQRLEHFPLSDVQY